MVEDAAIELVARAGQGSVRDALSLLDQGLASGERPVTVATVRRALGLADPAVVRDLLTSLAATDPAGALRAVAAAFDSGADARQLLREAARLARAAELTAIGYPEGAELGEDDAAVCRELATVAAGGFWVDALDRFAEAEANLRMPVDARLTVELCVLRLAHGGGGGDAEVRALTERIAALEAALRDRGPVTSPRTAVGRGGPGAVAAAATLEVTPPPAATPARPVAAHAVAPAPQPPASTEAPTTAAASSAAPPDLVRHFEGSPPAPVRGPEPYPVRHADAELSQASAEPAAPRGPAPQDLAEWKARWPGLIDLVNRRDRMLAGVLRSCQPIDGASARLVIGAPYSGVGLGTPPHPATRKRRHPPSLAPMSPRRCRRCFLAAL